MTISVDSILVPGSAIFPGAGYNRPALNFIRMVDLRLDEGGISVRKATWFVDEVTTEGRPFARREMGGHMYIFADWLDTAFPEWRTRHTVAVGLSLPEDDVWKMMFGIGPYAQSSEPGAPGDMDKTSTLPHFD